MSGRRSGETVGFRAPSQPAPSAPPHPARWLRPATVALAAAAALWLVALVAAVAAIGPFVPAAAPPSAPLTRPAPAGAAGLAARFVAAALEAGGADSQAALRPYIVDDIDLSAMTPATWYVNRATAVDVRPSDDDWLVTVAADLFARSGRGYEAMGTRWFEVRLFDRDGRLVVSSLPAEVPAPVAPPSGPMRLPLAEPVAEPTTQVVASFLRAYLTGGDVAPFLAPDADVASFTAPPYATATLWRLGVAQDRRFARAEVITSDAATRALVLRYALELSDVDGQPKVSRVHAD